MKKNSALYLIGGLVSLLMAGVSAYIFSVPWVPVLFLGMAVASFATWIFLDLLKLKELFSKRTTMYGLNSAFMVLVVLAIATVLNLIANEKDWKLDLTKNRLHTLSEQSMKVVKNLQKDVTIKGFVNPQQQADFQKAFDKYTYHSKKLSASFVDVDKDPTAVQRYGVKTAGTLVFETGDRQVKVENLAGPDDPKLEEKITNAIISVTKGDKKTLCFTSGHGEKLLGDTQREGYSELKESLEGGRYKTEELSLIDRGSVPLTCEIVFIAGPRSDFLAPETKALEDFLKRGGKLLVLVDPDSSPVLQGFLAKYGVDWKPSTTVLETNRMQQLFGGNPLMPVVNTYDQGHEITRELKQYTVYGNATIVDKAATMPPGLTATSLFSTSARSFEMPVSKLKTAKGGRLEIDESKRGPYSLGVAVTGKAELQPVDAQKELEKKDEKVPPTPEEKKDVEWRLVVVGDSDFATNQFRRIGLNADMFQNIVAWLAKEEDLIAVRPKASDASELQMTDARARAIIVTSVIFAPLFFWVFGFYIWWTRRRM